ncbi:helix-turn-helix domain-containing protein [Usitatibacter palustris]|uniref:helix-turn-helix domain-containing protein n=1 Tax=Usitatibacter palustris TaxID=2732487 RepID=UPI0014892F7D|nr:hypothetical protein [Usitatibacter palustris]
MRITQREFANWFGFHVASLRHWERGNRDPSGTALVLLHVVRENPRVVRQALMKARRANPAAFPTPERPATYRAPPGFGQRPPPLRPRGPRSKHARWPMEE